MKKCISLLLSVFLVLSLCVPATALESEIEPAFIPETYTQEELLAMDAEMDSDGDGLINTQE